MNNTNKPILEFIKEIIKYDNVDDILNTCNMQSECGFIFERLFDIVIKFGFCPLFLNTDYYHLVGNSNNGKLKILQSFDKYLQKLVISGKSTGCSDITLKSKKDDSYIFISSKYPKTDEDIDNEKSVEYYDIQNIIAIIDHNKFIYKKYKIYLIVPDKKIVIDKVRNTDKSSEYLSKFFIKENILDKTDLNKYFSEFKKKYY